MSSTLRSYIESTGRLPEDSLLGYIAFSTGVDAEHDRDVLMDSFKELKLDTRLVPPTSRAVDAFKKAIRKHQGFGYALRDDLDATVMIREVDSQNPREIDMRVIMREAKVRGRPKIGWEAVGEVKLFRSPRQPGTSRVNDDGARFSWALGQDLTEHEHKQLTQLSGMVHADYERFRSSLDGSKIRAMNLNYFRGPLQSVQLKESVHFIPVTHADELHRFAQAVNRLSGCSVSLIPIVDLEDQRDYILGAFQEDNERVLTNLLQDVQQLRAVKVTPKAYVALRERYDAIMGRTTRYAETLGESIDRTTGASGVVKSALVALAREFMNREGG